MSGKNDSVLSEIDKLLKNVDTTGMEGGAKRKNTRGCGTCGSRKGTCGTNKKGGSKCEITTVCGDNTGPCSVSPSCGGAKKKYKSKSKSKAKAKKSKSKSKAKKMVKKLVKKIKSKSKAKKTKSKSKAKKAKIARYMDSEMFGGAKKKSKSKSKGKKVKREPNMFIKTLMEVKKHVKKMDLPEDVKDGPAMSKVVSTVMKAKDMDAKKSVEHIKDNFSKFLNDYKKTQHEMQKKREAKKAAKSA